MRYRIKLFLLLLLFSILNFLAWNYCGFLIIICLLILIDCIKKIETNNYLVILVFAIFALLYNISSTFWLYSSDSSKSIMVFIFSSIIMCISFLTLFFLKKILNSSFVFLLWPLNEWLLSNWDLGWPWLTLGNSLANCWPFIKWYNIVGAYGGSLWLICVSLLLYITFKNKKKGIYVILLLLPCFVSLFNYQYGKSKTYNSFQDFLIFVPNSNNSNLIEKNRKIMAAMNVNNQKSPIVVAPELYYTLSNKQIKSEDFQFFKRFISQKFPESKIVSGVEFSNDSILFNTVAVISSSNIIFKTKKRYVPINEFTHPILEPLFGKSIYRKNSQDDSKKIRNDIGSLPFVCYEILFSDYVAQNSIDSNYIILLSSEDFMNNSFYGKKQYLNLVRLRAIENNRYLIKSSFKGNSCVISPNGDVMLNVNKEFINANVPIMIKNSPYQIFINFFSELL